MKILVAIDFGNIDPVKDKNKILVNHYDNNECKDLTFSELVNLKPGEIIIFDKSLLKYDIEDDNFIQTEFYGILEK